MSCSVPVEVPLSLIITSRAKCLASGSLFSCSACSWIESPLADEVLATLVLRATEGLWIPARSVRTGYTNEVAEGLLVGAESDVVFTSSRRDMDFAECGDERQRQYNWPKMSLRRIRLHQIGADVGNTIYGNAAHQFARVQVPVTRFVSLCFRQCYSQSRRLVSQCTIRFY